MGSGCTNPHHLYRENGGARRGATGLGEKRPRSQAGASDDDRARPLSRQETGQLVSTLVGHGIRKETKKEIVGAASGNPLYAVEYVRMLEDRPGEVLGVPETVQAIIASRLDSLSARDKALLQDGAVVGRVVWPGRWPRSAVGPRRPLTNTSGSLPARSS